MRRSLITIGVLALATAGLIACGDDGNGGTGPEESTPTRVTLSQTQVTVKDAQSIRLTATVYDQDDREMSGVDVDWSSANPEIAAVDDGTVTGQHPGTTEITARAGQASATAAVYVEPVATRLGGVSGDDQEGMMGSTLADSLVVRVLDRHGNGVAGVTVTFVVTAGGGTVSPAQATTNSAGRAAAEWTLGDGATTQKVEARVQGLDGSPVVFTATATQPPNVARIELSETEVTLKDGDWTYLSARVYDQNDERMSDIRVMWSSADPDIATVEDGKVTAHRPGTTEITASVGKVSAKATVTVEQVPRTLLKVSGDEQTGATGAALDDSLVVRVTDRHGDGVPGVEVRFVVMAGGGVVSPLEATTNDEGYAAAEWVLGAASEEQTVEARATGLDGSPVTFTATAELTEPGEVAIGDTIYGAISKAEEIDVYTVEGKAGEEFNIFFQPLNNSGSFTLELFEHYGTASEELLARIDYATATTDLHGHHTGRSTFPGDGTYTIVVRGSSSSSVGAYRFQIFPIDRRPESIDSTVAVGNTVAGEGIDLPGDIDVFTFEGKAGQEINIFLQPLAGSGNLTLELYEYYGTHSENVLVSVDASATTDPRYYHTGRFALPHDGTYTVVVQGTYESSVGEYSYEIVPIDRQPESIASTVAIGNTIAGERIDLPGDIDVFTFEGKAGQEIIVFFQPLSGSDPLTLEVYEHYGTPNQNVIASIDGAWSTSDLHENHTFWTNLRADGTYTILVLGDYASATGAYRFQIFPVDRSPESIPSTVAIGDTIVGERVDPRGDIDVFTFEGKAGQEINIFFQPLNGSSYLNLQLYENFGTEEQETIAEISSANPTSDLHQYHTGRITLTHDGTYSIVVFGIFPGILGLGWEFTEGPYRFQVFEIDPRPESIESTVAIGDTIVGESIDPPGDIDVFTFTGTAGQVVDIGFQPYWDSDALYLEVYDRYGTPQQELLGSLYAFATTNLEEYVISGLDLPRDGEYAIVVSGYVSPNIGPYQFQIRVRE